MAGFVLVDLFFFHDVFSEHRSVRDLRTVVAEVSPAKKTAASAAVCIGRAQQAVPCSDLPSLLAPAFRDVARPRRQFSEPSGNPDVPDALNQ